MKTVTVQIGNTDNKLTQQEWAHFVDEVGRAIIFHTSDIKDAIRFCAPSIGWSSWQNACWVFSCSTGGMISLADRLTAIRARYKQDFLAWTEGKTEFI